MSKSTRSIGSVSLNDEWVARVVDIVQGELEVPELDIEQRESLERVVVLSIGMYFMLSREYMENSMRLTQ
jgi:hypothetical protein